MQQRKRQRIYCPSDSSSSESIESSSPTPMATLLPQWIPMSSAHNARLFPHDLPVVLGLSVTKEQKTSVASKRSSAETLEMGISFAASKEGQPYSEIDCWGRGGRLFAVSLVCIFTIKSTQHSN